MTSIHEPTPEFERFLRWQVTTAARRAERFMRPAVPIRSRQYLRLAALVAASMLIGAFGMTATARLQENQHKQELLLQQQVDLRLAELKGQAARQALEDTQRRFAAGTAGRDVLDGAVMDERLALFDYERAKLKYAEVLSSGQPPREDIASPAVGGRDFVGERLQLDRQSALVRLQAAQQAYDAVTHRYAVGLAGEVALFQAQCDVENARSAAQSLDEQLGLRQRILSGAITAEQGSRERQLVMANHELRVAQSRLRLATRRLDLVRQSATGIAGKTDLIRAQLDQLEAQQEIATLQARIAELKRGS
jgi:hypothetical protein